MADLNHRVTELENEIKVIKNEVKAILLDVREQYLNTENPFIIGGAGAQGGQFSAVINCQTDSPESKPNSPADTESKEDNNSNSAKDQSEEEIISENEKDKKARKSTLPSLSMGSDSGEGKTPHGNKTGNKMKTAFGKFLSGDNDSDTGLSGEGQFGKDSWNKKQAAAKSGKGNNGNINLLTIAALSRWVDESTEKIGKERAEVMVEACHLVGHISNEFKDLLIRLVRLSQADEPKKGRINTQDYLGVIARLDGLLGYNNGSESSLLSILTDNKESHNG
jgi:hypothetical protein